MPSRTQDVCRRYYHRWTELDRPHHHGMKRRTVWLDDSKRTTVHIPHFAYIDLRILARGKGMSFSELARNELDLHNEWVERMRAQGVDIPCRSLSYVLNGLWDYEVNLPRKREFEQQLRDDPDYLSKIFRKRIGKSRTLQ